MQGPCSVAARRSAPAPQIRLLDMVSNRYKESLDEFTNLLTGDEEPDQDELFALVSSLKKVSIFYNCHDMGSWNIWPGLRENEHSKLRETNWNMSPGLLEIVARARDTLTERQPLTVPEEAVRSLR